MNKKYLIPLAIIAVLPFGATAENISGAMYAAPATANNDHPAPTTSAGGPYGRIDIDTTDQDHIASTAYVKGAYNSAIAAVNMKQNLLMHGITDAPITQHVFGYEDFLSVLTRPGDWETGESLEYGDVTLVSGAAVKAGIKSQRVEVYTSWDDDTDKTEVPLITASQN